MSNETSPSTHQKHQIPQLILYASQQRKWNEKQNE